MKTIKIVQILILILIVSILEGCFRKCNYESIIGEYFIEEEKGVIHSLVLNSDDTFLHFYKKGQTELSSSGNWEWYNCQIRLNEWHSYGKFDESCPGICINTTLFVQGKYLNFTPDGNSRNSFIKK